MPKQSLPMGGAAKCRFCAARARGGGFVLINAQQRVMDSDVKDIFELEKEPSALRGTPSLAIMGVVKVRCQ